MKIAFVGYKIQEKYTQGVSNDEDSELLTFLNKKGLDVTPVLVAQLKYTNKLV